ncbi:MAG TPA: DUF4105 domain-containing protein [Steroidobacteraceae bacterium]|nr:DUF4105 domain-containing protein [Steroidobacteraceae bacterium]
MRSIRSAFCLVALCVSSGFAAHADVVDAPGADLVVSLITYGPGDVYWERFGHDAIQVRDRVSGQSVDFNYGVFDFDERGFLWNFARGYMHYMIDVERSDVDEGDYVDSGRSVTLQRLALSPAEAVQLRTYLLWNLRPENVVYDYNYYTNNCATRVRDALDRALGGALRKSLLPLPAAMTYRQQTARLMSAQPSLMLAIDLALGPMADRPLSAWQESFLPMVLERDLRGVRLPDGHGGLEPLVSMQRTIAPNRLPAPPAEPPNLEWPLGLAGLALAAAIVLTRRRRPNLYASLTTVYLVGAGLVGTVLLALWTLTIHRAAWYNANLLLFNPLAWALPAAVWRSRRGAAPTLAVKRLVALQLVAALAAVLIHALPGTVQQNQPWLLFAIPVWLAVAWGLRAGRRLTQEIRS